MSIEAKQNTKKTWSIQFISSRRNPFFMISALLMFAGCFSFRASLEEFISESSSHLLLLAVLNVYEFTILGLAYFLKKRRKYQDLSFLSALSVVFLFDPTFTFMKSFAPNWPGGEALYLAASLLLLIKSRILFVTILECKIERRVSLALLTLQLMFYGMPALYWSIWAASTFNAAVSAHFSIWFGMLLCLAYAFLLKWDVFRSLKSSKMITESWFVPFLERAPSFAVFISLASMIFAAEAPIYLSHCAPILLLIGAKVLLSTPREQLPASTIVMTVFALAVAGAAPRELLISLEGLDYSPLRTTLLGTALIYLWIFRRQESRWYIALAAIHCLLASAGATVEQMIDSAKPALHIAVILLPGSRLSMSIWILGGSFIFLLIGGYASLSSDWELKEDIELDEADQSEMQGVNSAPD
ncbi:MAG: hypothetical protein P1V97_11185 [Planctomycetota bacterium]|nr:hypothetical protein [Planctomycetota bacterium]